MSNPNIPEKCNACGAQLALENLFVDDGCPCNSGRGVNFKPKSCVLCKVDNCVKPGHRITYLYGEFCVAYVGAPIVCAKTGSVCAALGEP